MKLVDSLHYHTRDLSAFLINYQGGFVRRGLGGEIVYRLSALFSCDPKVIIIPFNTACTFLLVALFVYWFRKRHLCWYVLPLEIFLGCAWFIQWPAIMDSTLMLLFILMLYLFNSLHRNALRIVCITIVMLFTLNLHEASVYFCFPVMFLLLWNDNKTTKTGVLFFSLFTATMLVLISKFHGDQSTVDAIHASWGDVFNEEPTRFDFAESLSWSFFDTAQMHIHRNFGSPTYLPSAISFLQLYLKGFYIRPFVLLLIYYVMTNTVFVFRRNDSSLNLQDRKNICYLMTFQFLSLILMFTILSCDWVRVVCYWTLSSYAIFLMVDRKTIDGAFPEWYKRLVWRLDRWLIRLVSPKKGVVAVCLLVVCITPIHFRPTIAFDYSVVGRIMEMICHFLS